MTCVVRTCRALDHYSVRIAEPGYDLVSLGLPHKAGDINCEDLFAGREAGAKSCSVTAHAGAA
jgi:hypothetical protein